MERGRGVATGRESSGDGGEGRRQCLRQARVDEAGRDVSVGR